ncbi:MAG: ferrous iron transport protein A [Phycisphaerales bacterium]|nr:ferrous iron transport protein A [Phycisphaerales bacterium]
MNPASPDNSQPKSLMRPLTELRRGDRAIVNQTQLDPEHVATLAAMGLCASCELTVCRASGRGSPCIVQIDATRLGLAPEVAQKILATVVTRPCDCPVDGGCARPKA